MIKQLLDVSGCENPFTSSIQISYASAYACIVSSKWTVFSKFLGMHFKTEVSQNLTHLVGLCQNLALMGPTKTNRNFYDLLILGKVVVFCDAVVFSVMFV